MKIQKTELAQKLNKIKSVVPKKTTQAVLQGILVKDGYLIANNMEMTVKADGSSSFSMELAIAEDPIAVSMTLSGTSSKTESAVKGRLQVKNICDVTFQGTSRITASGKAPAAAPPADAVVIDLDELAAVPMPLADQPAA